VSDLRHLSVPAARNVERITAVSPILLRVAALLDWRFRKGVTFRSEFAPDLPFAAIAPSELEQILVNLLSNALDALAGRPTPIIQVRVRLADDAPVPSIEILVADNGAGVARSARDRLFEDFFTTKGPEAGTGLGLAVSREIARAAGGSLMLLDGPASWPEPAVTVFKLTLPAAPGSGAGPTP